MKKHAWIFYLLVSVIAIGEIYWLYHEEHINDISKETCRLTPRDMQEDIAYFFTQLRAIHPNLYEKYDSLTFVFLEKKMKEECSSPKTPIEFECILLKSQRFFDGHTGFLARELYKSMRKERFPEVDFQPDCVLLEKDTLLRIGDIPCTELGAALDSMVSWEYSVKRRNRWKNDLLNFLLVNKFREAYPFRCRIGKCEDGRVDTFLKSTAHLYDYRGYPVSNPCHQKMFDSLYFYSDKIAVLFYNTSDFRDNIKAQEEFVKFIDVFFKKLNQYDMQTLYIDVTRNGGGNDGLHSYIFAHLNYKEIQFEAHLTGKKEGVEKFCKYVNEISKDGQSWIETIGKPILKKGTATITQKYSAQTDQFGGDVYIIAGDNTYSAAFNFCAWAKRLQCMVLVGEEIGQRFPLYGNPVSYTLPHYGILFRIPSTIHWETPALPLRDGFLQPDIPYSLEKPLQLDDFKRIIGKSKSQK